MKKGVSLSPLRGIFRRLMAMSPRRKAEADLLLARNRARSDAVDATLSKIFGPGKQVSILAGPFRGMAYLRMSRGSQLLPKIMGTYEEPIHAWVEKILSTATYGTIIDVGCAEGYYAVGFARAAAKPRVLAVDTNRDALELARELASINGVEGSVEFFGDFDLVLRERLTFNGRTLVFMDVEGAEISLLDPENRPILREFDYLVELHDCFVPGLTDSVISFFQATHKISLVVDYPHRAKPNLDRLPQEDLDVAFLTDERRPQGMRWMFAEKY